MKAVVSLTLICLPLLFAMANKPEKDVKVLPIEMGIVLDLGTRNPSGQKIVFENKGEPLVRLYRRKNARINRALEFRTKKKKTTTWA